MRPLILQFKELPSEPNLDFSMIQYDHKLNLNIDKSTGNPAINIPAISTSTGTKTYDEQSDSDRHDSAMFMATVTGTFTTTESSDSDPTNISQMATLGTMTATRTMLESTDTDA